MRPRTLLYPSSQRLKGSGQIRGYSHYRLRLNPTSADAEWRPGSGLLTPTDWSVTCQVTRVARLHFVIYGWFAQSQSRIGHKLKFHLTRHDTTRCLYSPLHFDHPRRFGVRNNCGPIALCRTQSSTRYDKTRLVLRNESSWPKMHSFGASTGAASSVKPAAAAHLSILSPTLRNTTLRQHVENNLTVRRKLTV